MEVFLNREIFDHFCGPIVKKHCPGEFFDDAPFCTQVLASTEKQCTKCWSPYYKVLREDIQKIKIKPHKQTFRKKQNKIKVS